MYLEVYDNVFYIIFVNKPVTLGNACICIHIDKMVASSLSWVSVDDWRVGDKYMFYYIWPFYLRKHVLSRQGRRIHLRNRAHTDTGSRLVLPPLTGSRVTVENRVCFYIRPSGVLDEGMDSNCNMALRSTQTMFNGHFQFLCETRIWP